VKAARASPLQGWAPEIPMATSAGFVCINSMGIRYVKCSVWSIDSTNSKLEMTNRRQLVVNAVVHVTAGSIGSYWISLSVFF
jgi:hypothetical protein